MHLLGWLAHVGLASTALVSRCSNNTGLSMPPGLSPHMHISYSHWLVNALCAALRYIRIYMAASNCGRQ
jgi:hypothetical protein